MGAWSTGDAACGGFGEAVGREGVAAGASWPCTGILGAAAAKTGGFGGGTGVFGVGPFLMAGGAVVVDVCAGEGVGGAPFVGGNGNGAAIEGTPDAVVGTAAIAAVLGSRGVGLGVTFWLAATLARRSFSLRSSS